MAAYVMTFTVRDADLDYAPLEGRLRDLRSVELQEGVWLVESAMSAALLRNVLLPHLHRGDAVAVLPLGSGSDWAAANVSAQGSSWLRAYVS